ncbi:YqkE family protein [Cohnella suwonensis]|uniref:YqkE family protein n=1 Tax=Cohnella suwonensis TaxID=696072 RepID=A0ABW0M5P0_9BACL
MSTSNKKGNPSRRPRVGAAAGTNGSSGDDKPVTLKDLLGAGVIAKLKEQAVALKQEEADKAQRKRREQEEAREAERKRNENDFSYLLNHSSQDWKKFK